MDWVHRLLRVHQTDNGVVAWNKNSTSPAAGYIDPAMSPDGKRIAIALQYMSAQQLAVYERDREVMMRIVSNGALNNAPVWSPDGPVLPRQAPNPRELRYVSRHHLAVLSTPSELCVRRHRPISP
jgi:hypothetical protein